MSWIVFFCSCLGAFCLLVGYLIGDARGRRAEAADQERAEAMARRTHPVYRERPPDFDAIREAGRRAWAIQQERAAIDPPERSYGGKVHDIHGGPGQDCWCGYVGADHAATYALTRPETDEEFSARLAGVADEIVAWAHRAGEQWSGQ